MEKEDRLRHLFFCLLIGLSLNPAYAHHKGHADEANFELPEKTIKQIITILTQQGFHHISEVELEVPNDSDKPHYYEIEAINNQGQDVEIQMTTDGKFILIEND